MSGFFGKVLISILIYIFAILLTRTVGFAHMDKDSKIEEYFGNIAYSSQAAGILKHA